MVLPLPGLEWGGCEMFSSAEWSLGREDAQKGKSKDLTLGGQTTQVAFYTLRGCCKQARRECLKEMGTAKYNNV